MRRLTLFAKGNLDVRDSLHSLYLGGELRWNGINALAKERGLDVSIRVRHETATGSAALRRAPGKVPPALAARDLPLGSFTLAAQFSNAIFAGDADAIVLSLQPDVQVAPARHRRDGYLFQPHGLDDWPREDREWLMSEFQPGELADPDVALLDFEAVVTRLRAAGNAPILVYTLSSIVPGESVYCHAGMDDILSTRIKRFNLGLIELSQRTGIAVIDVDRIVAERGAREMKLDVTHLTAEGCRAVAEEVLRVLGDLGCIPAIGMGA